MSNLHARRVWQPYMDAICFLSYSYLDYTSIWSPTRNKRSLHRSVVLVFKVSNELGIQDGVTILNIINLVDGNDGSNSDEEHNKWKPDEGVNTGKSTCISNIRSQYDSCISFEWFLCCWWLGRGVLGSNCWRKERTELVYDPVCISCKIFMTYLNWEGIPSWR